MRFHPDHIAYRDEHFLMASIDIPRHALDASRHTIYPAPFLTDQRKGYVSVLSPTRSQYFLTFQGRFETNPMRAVIAQRLHDPAHGIIIRDSANLTDEEKTDGYWDLLFNSVFSLVMPGDSNFSYRFGETVCSGAIAVIVEDPRLGGMPLPFESIMKPEEYAVPIPMTEQHNIYSTDSETIFQRRYSLQTAGC